MSKRQIVNCIVRDYAQVNGGIYETCYNNLYREFNKENHCYIKSRAKKSKSSSVIDFIEKSGMIDNLLILAVKLFK